MSKEQKIKGLPKGLWDAFIDLRDTFDTTPRTPRKTKLVKGLIDAFNEHIRRWDTDESYRKKGK